MNSLLNDGLALPEKAPAEAWNDIPGYEGLYQASDLGRIRSCNGKTTSNARYARRVWKQRIMKQKMERRSGGKKQDARVCLWKNGEGRTLLVARLVALAWCGGYREGMTVNHIDGDTENNAASNLEWISMKENILHGFKSGLYGSQRSVVLIDINGYEMRFRSMAEASRYLGKTDGYLSGRLKKGVKNVCGYRVLV